MTELIPSALALEEISMSGVTGGAGSTGYGEEIDALSTEKARNRLDLSKPICNPVDLHLIGFSEGQVKYLG